MKSLTNKRWLVVLGKFIVLAGLVGALMWVWQQVHIQKVAMHQVQKSLNDLPERISGQAALKSELERHKHDIERLHRYTPAQQEGISEFVSELEKEAVREKIRFSINDIMKDQKTDESGNPIENTGPLNEVYIKGTANGRPEDLVSFLYTLEHMPYLVRVPEWTLQALATGNGASTIATIPTSTSGKEDVPEVPGQLFFTLVITARYE